jgi:hypothetical protein
VKYDVVDDDEADERFVLLSMAVDESNDKVATTWRDEISSRIRLKYKREQLCHSSI